MKVVVQYSADCPNWQRAHDLVRQALHQLAQPDDVLTLQAVSTPEEAESVGFRGSPTVLVDGVESWADPSAPVGLTCRVFSTPEGLAGSPTVEQLVEVLRAVA